MPANDNTPEIVRATKSQPVPYNIDNRDEIERKFLVEYCRYGSIHKAASSCGVSSNTIKTWLDQDDDFRDNFEKMKDIFVGALETLALERAMEGSDSLLVTLLKANAPEKYNPRPSQGPEQSSAPIVIQLNTAIFNAKEAAMIGSTSYTSEDSESTR